MNTQESAFPLLRQAFPERKIVPCPRCRMPVWEPTIETSGCPVCKALDGR